MSVRTASPPPGSMDRITGLRELAVPAMGLAAAATTAIVHVPVAVEHMDEVPYLGVAFYGFVIVTAALVGSLLVEQRAWSWSALLALNAAAVAVYALSRIFGLPDAADDKGDWVSTAGVVSVTAELVVVVAALVVVRRMRVARD